MIFYTADLHLGYFPILHDTARPFTGVPEMDEALISNWNARVGADDSVYIVGDFSYNGGEAPTQYLSRLNGHLHLIRGNHDTGLNHAERLLDYCDSVTDFLEIDDGGTHILLCHYPILHEKGGYMIHGHIHNQRNHAYEILKTLPRARAEHSSGAGPRAAARAAYPHSRAPPAYRPRGYRGYNTSPASAGRPSEFRRHRGTAPPWRSAPDRPEGRGCRAG